MTFLFFCVSYLFIQLNVSRGSTKEVVDYGRIIGKYYHEKTGKYYDTTRATIHYDSKGNAHIVPAAPKGFK